MVFYGNTNLIKLLQSLPVNYFEGHDPIIDFLSIYKHLELQYSSCDKDALIDCLQQLKEKNIIKLHYFESDPDLIIGVTLL